MTAFVLDTSYLLEFYGVPGFSEASFRTRVRERIKAAVRRGDTLHVPFAVVFETANHIADANDWTLAKRLRDDLRDSAANGIPWVVRTAGDDTLLRVADLLELCERLHVEFAAQGIGLSDAAVIEHADRIKRRYVTGHMKARELCPSPGDGRLA